MTFLTVRVLCVIWLANGARLATVIIAVLLTIYQDKFWRPLPSEAEDFDVEPPAPTTPDRSAAPRVRPGCESA